MHRFQYLGDEFDGRHPMIGVGGGVRGIQFAGCEYVFVKAGFNLICRDGVGEVGRQQGLEIGVRWQSRHDPCPVVARLLHRGDRRVEVGHDNRATKLVRRVLCYGSEHVAVTEVDMPVVWAADY